MKTLLTLTIALSLALFATACGESEVQHSEQEGENSAETTSIEEEACGHMANGPATGINAGDGEANATKSGVEDWEHKRVDITLADDGMGAYWGYVTFEATEAAEYVFFSRGTFYFQIDVEDAETTTSVPNCPGISKAMTFDLDVGEHMLFFMSPDDSLSMVVERADSD